MTKHYCYASLALGVVLIFSGCSRSEAQGTPPGETADTNRVETPAKAPDASDKDGTMEKVTRTDKEWREMLTDDQYYILREKGHRARLYRQVQRL